MAFEEISLNGEELTKIEARKVESFSMMAAYGSITQAKFDELNPGEQQELIDMLTPEKQAKIRQYQLEIQRAGQSADIARDVQRGTTGLAVAAGVPGSQGSITPEEMATVEDRARVVSPVVEVIPSEELIIQPTISESDLPETPNSSIAILRLMMLGYFPAKYTDRTLTGISKAGKITHKFQWIHVAPAQLRERREAEKEVKNTPNIDRAVRLDTPKFHRDIALAAKNIGDDLDRALAGRAQLPPDVQAKLTEIRQLKDDTNIGTDRVKQAKLVTSTKEILRLTGLTESKVFKSVDANNLKTRIAAESATISAAKVIETGHQRTAESARATAESTRHNASTAKVGADRDLALETVQRDRTLQNYNTFLSTPGVDLAAYHGKDLAIVETELRANIAAFTTDHTNAKIAETKALNAFNTALTPNPDIDLEYKKLNQKLGQFQTDLSTENAKRAVVFASTAPVSPPLVPTSNPIADGMAAIAKTAADTMNNYQFEQSKIKQLEVLDKKIEILEGKRDIAQTNVDAREAILEADHQSKQQLVRDANQKILDANTKLTKVQSIIRDPRYTAAWSAHEVAERSRLAAETRVNTHAIDITNADATIAAEDAKIQTAKDHIQNLDGELAKHQASTDQADIAKARLDQNFAKTLLNTLTGKGISKADAQIILNSIDAHPDSRKPALVGAVADLHNPHTTQAQRDSAFLILEQETLNRANDYLVSKGSIDRLISEAQARRTAIHAKIQAVETSHTLTASEIDAKRVEIIDDIAKFNTWTLESNPELRKYSANLGSIDPKLMDALSGAQKPGTTHQLVDKADKIVGKADPVTSRVGGVMLVAGVAEIASMFVQAENIDDKTEKGKAEKAERMRQAGWYAFDAGIGTAAFVPVVGGIATGFYDLGMAAKMGITGTDIAGNKISGGDIALRAGLGVIGMVPLVGQYAKGVVTTTRGVRIAETVIKSGNMAGKGAVLASAGMYGMDKYEKLNFGLMDVGSWNRPDLIPKAPKLAT